MNSYVVKRIFIGMILILIGTLFLGAQLGVITVNPGEIASTYWPVMMILFGISGLLGQVKYRKESGSSYIWNLFVIALGAGFLARNLNYLNMSTGELIKLIIPGFIILFGIGMMFRKDRPSKINQDYSNKYEYNYDYDHSSQSGEVASGPVQGPTIPVQDSVSKPTPSFHHSHSFDHQHDSSADNRSGFFGDLYLGHDYWELKPMNISHFIGDTIIDLTKAQIPVGDTKLNISAFIGDVKVFVPNDMEVEVSVTSSSFLGDSTVFSKRESGFMRSVREETQDFTMSDKKIRLQVSLFIGDITVQRVG
jgi:lia operon protein LiaF